MDLNLVQGRDNMTINLQFLIIPCKSVYNCILGRPFAEMLDAVASHILLKLKYQNICDGPITICVELSGARRKNKSLQRDQKGKIKRIY